jgi:phosphoribosyl-AMP cyclohydrolase
MEHDELLALVRYNADGLVPCVIQEHAGGAVLIVAYADEEALRLTLSTGELHLWSRSRRELWRKGATSGNVQRVRSLRLDCDHDAVLIGVDPVGPACHCGTASCFDAAASGGALVELPAAGE